MHTQTKVELLIKEACSHNRYWKGNAVAQLDLSTQFSLSKPSQARLQALAEAADLPTSELLALLLETALGDAHEGYMAAFDGEALEEQNLRLKKRVSELL